MNKTILDFGFWIVDCKCQSQISHSSFILHPSSFFFLFHGNNLDDFLLAGVALLYIGGMYVYSRIQFERRKKAKLQRRAARLEAERQRRAAEQGAIEPAPEQQL